jgi:hypothetical protein
MVILPPYCVRLSARTGSVPILMRKNSPLAIYKAYATVRKSPEALRSRARLKSDFPSSDACAHSLRYTPGPNLHSMVAMAVDGVIISTINPHLLLPEKIGSTNQ